MSQTYGVENSRGRASAESEASGWAVGWTVFAAVMLVVQGCWWIFAGIVALLNNEFYVATQEYILQFDVTTWAWIHLLVGVLIFAAGVALFSGATWARAVGVLVASLAMLVGFAWMPWYPVWAIMFIVISVAVIWALTAHGRDIRRF
jgi:hypothetical protein